jgi:hypothetical protein
VPVQVASESAAEPSSITVCETSITRRRSTRSAVTPPTSEKTTIGTTRVRPKKPSARAERVSRYTCHCSATVCIWVPVSETSCDAHSSRKSRWRRTR